MQYNHDELQYNPDERQYNPDEHQYNPDERGCYFSPRRSYRRVPKFCVGFEVTQKRRFVDPPALRGVDLLGFFSGEKKVLRIEGSSVRRPRSEGPHRR